MTFTKHLLFSFLLLFCLTAVVGVSLPAWADTRYVSDRLIISVREGTAPDDPVVAYLTAGTPVEVLEEAGEHLHVRTADGKQGWVRTKFILAEQPKWMEIKNLRAEIDRLEAHIDSINSQTGQDGARSSDSDQVYELKIQTLETAMEKEKQASQATRNELDALKTRYSKLLDDFNSLSKQNAAISEKSDNASALLQEIEQLKQSNQELKKELKSIRQSGQSSMLTSNARWFLIGGGVLLLGIILGKSVRRKKSYGY
ncbi:MAG: TIGR04211 family SH3 domain-containing protein [Deltaproteobacteria bacterium]|nr:TIGR04211 family SH3 domain-containing protein [Deltaproteobacteria bacterium]